MREGKDGMVLLYGWQMSDNAQTLQEYLMSVNFHTSFAIKPDTARVGHVIALNDFIKEYPDEELTPNLLRLAERFKYYRPICGDGNCFYRACAFIYFSVANLRSFEDTFLAAPVKDCYNVPFDLEEYDVREVLVYIWKEYLLPLKDMSEFQRRIELRRKLNGSVLLDAFLIAYLRSLNHQHIRNHRGQFAAFIQGNFERELGKVLMFGREAEGIELFAMAQLLRVRLTIMMVHKENFQQIVYMEDGKANFHLFFRPGHYDILCQEEEYRYQGSSARNASPSPVHRNPSPSAPRNPGSSAVRSPPQRLPTMTYGNRQIEPEVVMINSVIDFKDKEVYIWKFPPKNKPENVASYYQERGVPPSQKKQPKSRSPQQPKKQNDPARHIERAASPPQRSSFQPSSISIPNIKSANMKVQGIAIFLVVLIIVIMAVRPTF